MKRLTTRGIKTATAILNREPFNTSGSLTARIVDGLGNWDSGRLYGEDLDLFRAQCDTINYVVYSYATPIAWHWALDNGTADWYVAKGKWSLTTSKHQSNLYMVKPVEVTV